MKAPPCNLQVFPEMIYPSTYRQIEGDALEVARKRLLVANMKSRASRPVVVSLALCKAYQCSGLPLNCLYSHFPY